MQIKLTKIKFDERLQNRVKIDTDTVKEYSDAIESGIKLPDVTVFFDGSDYWLADGFHRYHAHDNLKILEINADVRNGTLREAILFSVGVNAAHGLRRTNADKRKAVCTLLNDREWNQLSDREIARLCSVSHNFVSELRKSSLSSDDSDKFSAGRTYTTKHGTQAVMNTANIGSKSNASQDNNSDDLEQINKELSHEIVSLEEENQKLRDAISAGQLPDAVEIQTAEEIIIDLRKQVKNLQIELQAVKESRDKCKQEIISLKSQCARQAKQLKSLGVANNA